MKPKVPVFIFCVMMALAGFPQSSSCKFEIDKTDPATNAPVKKIKTKLTGTDVFYFIISRNDTAYTLTLNFWVAGAVRDIIDKNDKVTIVLSGGDILTLFSNADSKPIPHYGDQAWTEYNVNYLIRSDDLAKMLVMKPLSLVLKVGIEPFNRELNKNDVEKIKGIIRCIMK